MHKIILLASVAWAGIASVAAAQQAAPQAQATPEAADSGDIIVTATRRPERLQDVPIAVNVVTAESLANSGASDIRTLNQLSPSLLVSSTSSEAGAGVARIRGVGTVGDNPGLESSVAVFVDGVYRNRSGVALTELGPVERIEVLRGPQGTLFGRNASAGLINVVTAKPKFDNEGYAAFTIGNYEAYRVEGGFTGPIFGGDKVAARFDGVWYQRDGFIRDVISDRRVNDRDRYLLRGQLLFEPTDDLSIRVVADYAKRNEECCAAVYAPLTDYQRAAGTPAGQVGDITKVPSIFAPVLRAMNDPAGNPAYLNDDLGKYRTGITPGRSFQSDVRDWGLSGEVNWDLGGINVTSITAYRDWRWDRGQDADYNNLDLFYRDDYRQTFKTFTQELRAQGEAFGGRLDWLVGGYFAHEDLDIRDNLKFGTQFDQYASRFLAFANPALAAFPAFGYANLKGFTDVALTAQGVPAAIRPLFTSRVRNLDINDVGETGDLYSQTSRNFAFFTHNEIKVTEKLGLTLGLRYTNEKKEVSTDFNSNNTACADIRQSITDVAALGANPALKPIADAVVANLRGLSAIPCLINLNTLFDLDLADTKKEDQFTGTAVLSYKMNDDLLVYGSYSRGYKAGGFNLDRSALNPTAPQVTDLLFAPETVNAYEIGAKYDGRGFDVNVALFRQDFKNFQLNTFNGLSFIVENIGSCGGDLDPATGASFYGACSGKLKPGLRSQGVEVEIFTNPLEDLALNFGMTYADTKYRDNLVGADGRAIPNDLFRLPGEQLSNAPKWVLTGAATFTPPIGDSGYSALFYLDGRWQSGYNTGSDLDIEKEQGGFAIFNARVGLRGPDQRWSLEFWAQNLFDERYTQVAFDAPLQPIGGTPGSRVTDLPAGTTLPNGTAFSANRSNALYGRFPGEPRTFGMTIRTKF